LPDGRLWVDRIAYDPGRLILAFGQTENYRRSSTAGFRLGGRWLSLSGNHIHPVRTGWIQLRTSKRRLRFVRMARSGYRRKPRQGWNPDENGKPPIEEPAALVQFGVKTNWQSVARYLWDKSVLLLKQDGTLWGWSWLPRYGKQPVWPGYRHFEPHLLKRNRSGQRSWLEQAAIMVGRRMGAPG